MPVPIAGFADASNTFEDLSGVLNIVSDNPYDTLLQASHDDPVQLQARYNTHRTTRNSQQKAKLLAPDFSGVILDLILQKVEDPVLDVGFADPRNCLVFWARPPQKIRDLIGNIQQKLRKVAPNLWLMPLERLHMTALEITHSRTEDEIAMLVSKMRPLIPTMADYTLTHRSRLVKPTLSYDGAAIALSFLPAAGEGNGEHRTLKDDGYTYHHLRRDLYSLSKETGITIESRYTVPSSHLTIGRFTTAKDYSKVDELGELIPDPERMRRWVATIEETNEWLEEEYWPKSDGTNVKDKGEWIVGEEKGLDCRAGTLWYGGGESRNLHTRDHIGETNLFSRQTVRTLLSSSRVKNTNQRSLPRTLGGATDFEHDNVQRNSGKTYAIEAPKFDVINKKLSRSPNFVHMMKRQLRIKNLPMPVSQPLPTQAKIPTPASPQHVGGQRKKIDAESSESEWEYEYSETETETHYLILDLSASGPYIKPRQKAVLQTPQSAEHLQAGSGTLDSTVSTPAPDPPQEPTTDDDQRFQILDLHTPNPIVSYQKHIYSCHWSSTIGTDLLFTKASSPSSPHDAKTLPALRSTQEWDLLAATQLKLVATPAKLVPKSIAGHNRAQQSKQASAAQPLARVTEPSTTGLNSQSGITVPASSSDVTTATRDTNDLPTKIPVGKNASAARHNQVHFLEQLIAVKKRKGEEDEVTVFSQKRFTGSGWRVRQNERKRREAERQGSSARDKEGQERQDGNEEGEDEGEEGKEDNGSVHGEGNVPEDDMRDYRPRDRYDAPANIRAVPTATPASWDELTTSTSTAVEPSVQSPNAKSGNV
ncbi:MAG: transport between ER and Golgi ATPase protein [Pycnora praestabilis]|nr:MAG: transport between ER and Golgi ATPase protein [Pycnora praestabilis]